MNMKRFVTLTVLGMMMLGLSTAVVCAGEGKGSPQTKTGVVKKVDVDGRQIVVTVTRDMTFAVTDATKIVQSGAAKKLSDIKVDGKVSVDYVKDGDTRTATKIVILKDK
ncbi:MAG: hypothetical protein NT105_11475 [Verrucomicrobia bacterium]|nr:hypothetical protein [Verrucomicrobiota bacterium]